MLLYLDSCCYNRPFDDLSQIRVRLEAEAVEWILEESRTARFTVVTSDYLSLELIRNPDPAKRAATLAMTAYAGIHVAVAETLARRAEEIEAALGITGFDALHLAAAETAGCDHLVTTDDGLLKKSKRHSSQLKVSVLNPIDIVSLP
jgi:predicted nucleic acid-binding protein